MKKSFILFLGCLLFSGIVAAQKDASQPVVIRPVYFDVSPPLTDMIKNFNEPADMSWKDGVVKNNPDPRRLKGTESDNEEAARQFIQSWFGLTDNSDGIVQNFDGVYNTSYGLVPPDTDGDVGPNHYFQVVNVRYAIYSKTGSLLFGPANNSSIFSGLPNNSNDGDAVVLYDETADRWLFTQFSLPNYPNGPYFEMVAVSQTNNPTGSWYRYQYSYTTMPDYPKFGIWPDGYYMSCNRFNSSMSYQGIGAYAMNRTKMLAGDPTAEIVMFTLTSGNEAYSMLPSDCDGDFPPSGTPNYFTYLNDGPDRIGIYAFHVDWANTAASTFTLFQQIPVTSFSGGLAAGIPQKGSSIKLDAIAGRFMFRLPFRKFNDHWSMVASGTISVSGIAGIRWYELRNTGTDWTIYQEGTYAPGDGHYRWMGSMAQDTAGNIALGFSISSSTLFPSVRYTGRLANDPLNEMTLGEEIIMAGGGAQTNNFTNPSRWGDYSAMAVDPSAEATFWYTQEYYQANSQSNWRTRIAAISFAGIMSLNVSADPNPVCLGDSTQLSANVTGGSGSYTFSWTSDPPGFTSGDQEPWATPVVATKYLCTVNDGTQIRTDSVQVNVNTDPYVFAGNDTTYANTVNIITCYGSASGYNSLLWTTSGDGYFWKDTIAETFYYPGTLDKSNGHVTLTLTATPLPTCTDVVSDDVYIQFVLHPGIGESSSETPGIQLMPNPATGKVRVTITGFPQIESILTITSAEGKFMYSETLVPPTDSFAKSIDLTGFPRGIYLVKLQNRLQTVTKKLVLE